MGLGDESLISSLMMVIGKVSRVSKLEVRMKLVICLRILLML